jgi:hypothetical protein
MEKEILRPVCKLGPVAMCWALKENRRADIASMCRLPGIYVVGTRNNDSVREQCRHPEKMEEGDKAPCLPRRQVGLLGYVQ